LDASQPPQSKVKIDEIDRKILTKLVANPRVSIKSISEDCNISSVATFKRIKRLKDAGVILGTVVFPAMAALSTQARSVRIGLNLKPSAESEVCKYLVKRAHLFELYRSIGKYDLVAAVIVKDSEDLNNLTQAIGRISGVKRIATNTWVPDPIFCLENVTFDK
jgi:DNA-binding Lrp family transcriptional regulator